MSVETDADRTISKTNDPDVKKMRKLHWEVTASIAMLKMAIKIELHLPETKLPLDTLCSTEQVTKLQLRKKHQQSGMCKSKHCKEPNSNRHCPLASGCCGVLKFLNDDIVVTFRKPLTAL